MKKTPDFCRFPFYLHLTIDLVSITLE